MDRVYDPGWVIILGQSAMYSKMLHEGETAEGKT
jgi:hypothetical protein